MEKEGRRKKNSILRSACKHIPLKNIFLISTFEPLYFLKSGPIFDELVLPVFSKNNGFRPKILLFRTHNL